MVLLLSRVICKSPRNALLLLLLLLPVKALQGEKPSFNSAVSKLGTAAQWKTLPQHEHSLLFCGHPLISCSDLPQTLCQAVTSAQKSGHTAEAAARCKVWEEAEQEIRGCPAEQ